MIDGQQRLTSLFSFIDGKFPSGDLFKLIGLTAYKELNKKALAELTDELQNRIQDYNLRTVTLLKQSDADRKFEIFDRFTSVTTIHHVKDRAPILNPQLSRHTAYSVGTNTSANTLLSIRAHAPRNR